MYHKDNSLIKGSKFVQEIKNTPGLYRILELLCEIKKKKKDPCSGNV